MVYRAKPVLIEAVHVSDVCFAATYDWKALPVWLVERYELGFVMFMPNSVYIKTLDGRAVGKRGDMIIRNSNGDIYPCTMETFRATYELAEQ